MTIDVLFVTHNSDDQLSAAIAALWPSSTDLQAQKQHLIIVDSGSDSTDRLRRINCKQLYLTKNYGFGTSANVGMRDSPAEWIALINPDARISYHQLEEIAVAADADGADIAAPLLRDPQGRNLPHLYTKLRPPWKSPARTITTTDHPNPEPNVAAVLGAVMMLRRKEILSLGGFNERYFMYAEELDLCLRLTHAGGRVALINSVEAIHFIEQGSTGVSAVWRSAQRIRGKALYFKIHHGRTAGLLSIAADLARHLKRNASPRHFLALLACVLQNPRRGLPWPPVVEAVNYSEMQACSIHRKAT